MADINYLKAQEMGYTFILDLIDYDNFFDIFESSKTGGGRLDLQLSIIDWCKESDIKTMHSKFFGVIYFNKEEDKVKFILKWL